MSIVETFFAVLTSKLTQHDIKQSKGRFHNPNALGLYMQRVEEAREHVGQSDDVELLRNVLAQDFDKDFPPVRNVLKQINDYLSSGKRPKIVGRDPSKKCSHCGGGVYYGEHYSGCQKSIKAKHRPSKGGYGVFVFAEWYGDAVREQPERGYVDRPMDGVGVPYSRMTPVRVFKSRALAKKLADKLTFGETSKRDPKSRIPVGGATHPRTLPAFKKETAALLETRGTPKARAKRLVRAHTADVKRAWKKRQPPCAATDTIVREEKRGMHGKRDPGKKTEKCEAFADDQKELLSRSGGEVRLTKKPRARHVARTIAKSIGRKYDLETYLQCPSEVVTVHKPAWVIKKEIAPKLSPRGFAALAGIGAVAALAAMGDPQRKRTMKKRKRASRDYRPSSKPPRPVQFEGHAREVTVASSFHEPLRVSVRDPAGKRHTIGNIWGHVVEWDGHSVWIDGKKSPIPTMSGSSVKTAMATAESYLRTVGSMQRHTRTQNDPGRRGHRTQSEHLASITWNIKDAKEALTNAVGMNDWRGVAKYTKQIEVLEQKYRKSEHPSMKRSRGRGMQSKFIAGHRFGRGELPGGAPSKRYEIQGASGETLWNVATRKPQTFYSRAKAEAAFAKLREEHGPLPSGVRIVELTGPESPPHPQRDFGSFALGAAVGAGGLYAGQRIMARPKAKAVVRLGRIKTRRAAKSGARGVGRSLTAWGSRDPTLWGEKEHVASFRKELKEVERGDVENRIDEWRDTLEHEPEHVAERIDWLLTGQYGQGAYLEARKTIRGRSNAPAWLTQVVGAIEWGVPFASTRRVWTKLSNAQKLDLARHVDKVISSHLNR